MTITTTDAPRVTTEVAVRAEAAVKVYGGGRTEVRALDGVDHRHPVRPLHRGDGPVGLGQVDADALPRRPRHAQRRAHPRSVTSTSAGSPTGS